MPVHQQSNNVHPTKPLMPAFSSRLRAAGSPSTPKLASSFQTSPALSRSVTDSNTRANIASIARDNNPPLSGNITPRSGNRRSRIGTDSPNTPGDIASIGAKRTKAVSGSKASRDEVVMNGTGLGISSPVMQPQTVTRILRNNASSPPSPNHSQKVSKVKSGTGSDDSLATSPFFHANDAKSSISSSDALERPQLAPKATAFFYLGNGNVTASPDAIRSHASRLPQPEPSKFFHANDLQGPSLKSQSSRPALNKKKSTASIGSPRLGSPDTQRMSKSPSRPASPLKEAFYRSAPSPVSSSPKSRTIATPILTARSQATERRSFGSSVSSTRQTLHKKSSSTNTVPNTSLDNTPVSPLSKHTPFPELQISPTIAQNPRLSRDMTLPDYVSSRSTSLTSTFPLPNLTATIPHLETASVTSPLPSPQKSPETSKPPPTPAQEAAINARRERKVLDLEISNSSLLAINKTLEREMRKQSAELRRFQRLSRSGRLSMRTVSDQSKSSLGILAEHSEGDGEARNISIGVDELDLGDSDEDASISDEDSNFSPTASESASNLSSTHALKQRKRDEKRLMLDLSKHRQLLMDSEKMSSSIRRCLAWSEVMIKDGQKALDHQVTVGDVQLGGRVLERDDEDSDGDRRMGLVSPSRVIGAMEADRLWVVARDESMSPLDLPLGFNDLHAAINDL